MHFSKPTAELFIPDGSPESEALARTTHLAIGAHQDDLEIMALEGILACFTRDDQWFSGVVVTDGAGSARTGLYAGFTDEEMKAVRRSEQKKAALVGEYAAVVMLDHPSQEIRNPGESGPVQDIAAILAASTPETVYIHNLADKHPTHVAVALRSIDAIRSLSAKQRPKKLYGCEVWRDLDWMVDEEKVVFRLDERQGLSAALVGIFDSQIAGGKRYDLATAGRRLANATYFESHQVDAAQLINFGMDLTPLVEDDRLDPQEYVLGFIDRFKQEVAGNIRKFKGAARRE